jgi:hypothetical protein
VLLRVADEVVGVDGAAGADGLRGGAERRPIRPDAVSRPPHVVDTDRGSTRSEDEVIAIAE